MNDFYEQVKLIGEKAELYEHIGLVHKFEKKTKKRFSKNISYLHPTYAGTHLLQTCTSLALILKL